MHRRTMSCSRPTPASCGLRGSTRSVTSSSIANGIRVASPLRMLFGLASQFNDHRFARAAEDAWLKRLVTPDDARTYLERDPPVRSDRACGG